VVPVVMDGGEEPGGLIRKGLGGAFAFTVGLRKGLEDI